MNDQQRIWDAEDSLAFRSRLRELQRHIVEAREQESAARSTFAQLVRVRKDAELKLRAFLEEDIKPLPLFDRRVESEPQEEPQPVSLAMVSFEDLKTIAVTLNILDLDLAYQAACDRADIARRTILADELARRALADPRGMPVTALGPLDGTERRAFREEGIESIDELIDYLDEFDGGLNAALLAIDIPKLAVGAIADMITKYRDRHSLQPGAPAQEEAEESKPPVRTLPLAQTKLTEKALSSAYIVPAVQAARGPALVKPVTIEGNLYVCTGKCAYPAEADIEQDWILHRLYAEPTFRTQFIAQELREKPGLEGSATAWWTGVCVKVGKHSYVIGPDDQRIGVVKSRQPAEVS